MIFSKALIQEIQAEILMLEADWRDPRRNLFVNSGNIMLRKRPETIVGINKATNEFDCGESITVYEEHMDFELTPEKNNAVQDLLDARPENNAAEDNYKPSF